ncbi:MAG: DUF2961 domain-containing protein [bacterium]|nr:DUF2961 domain-containing protein [bacterium]
MSSRLFYLSFLAALVVAGGLLMCSCAIAGETFTYSDLLMRVVDLDRLPYFVEGEECDQFSSYDRRSRYDEATGKYIDWDANGDSGNYIRFDADTGEDVMAEMKGPGFINRIWSANPQGKIRFYIDGGEPIELDFNELFSGKIEPFRRPIVWQRRVVLGGDNPASDCYLPIPYQKSCKVTSVRTDKANRIIQYFHIGYTTLPAGTKVPTFGLGLTDEEKAMLTKVCERLSNCGQDPQPKDPLRGKEVTVTVPPGGTNEVFVIEGPAIIHQVRGKVSAEGERAIGRKVLLKVFWDDEDEPSIWAPLGDFFGASFADSPYASLPLGMKDGAGYSYWRMPFRKRAKFVVTNEARKPCQVSLDVRFQNVRDLPRGTSYFHAKWRRERECATFDYPFVESTGRGRFVGAALFVDNVHGGWWGEGDEKVYVDGEKFPSFFGTGSEDYFGDAWGIRYFVNPFHGCPMPDPVQRQQVCYRWHIIDSVPFRTQFKITIENYSATEAVKNDYASMAYWYQMPGGSDFFKPVPVEQRLPLAKVYVPGAIEAEGLFPANRLPAGASVVDDAELPGELSGGAGLKLTGKVGDRFVLSIPVAKADVYALEAVTAQGVPEASFQLVSPAIIVGGKARMKEGRNDLTFTLTQAAPGQTTCEAIVDYILLVPYKNYVREWMLIGPWDNTDKTGLRTVYPPEQEIAFDKKYQGKAGEVAWKKVRVAPDGVVNLLQHMSPSDNVVAYGYFCVTAPDEITTDMYVGSDDGVRVWINGKLVHDHRVDRGLQPDQDAASVTLLKGKNAVLVKVDQGIGDWGFTLRFRDPDEVLQYNTEAP